MRYRNRMEAGTALAEALANYKGQRIVVLALPRGGVPVALPVAKSLRVPVHLLLVRKLGIPGHSEVGMGAIVDGDPQTTVRNEIVLRGHG